MAIKSDNMSALSGSLRVNDQPCRIANGSSFARSRRAIAFIVVLSLGTIVIPAAVSETYYVDFANSEGTSADTNIGTTQSAALVHCPGDSHYSGSLVLSSGDTVVFKRGVTYSGSITTQSSGVTYTVTNWGTGDAVLDGSTNDYVFQVQHSNVTIDGAAQKAMKLTGPIKHAAIWNYAVSQLTGSTFTNLRFIDIGNASSVEGIGIKIGGNDVAYTNYEISHNEIVNCYSYAIKISGKGANDIDIFDNLVEGNGYNPTGRTQINISSNSGLGVQNVKIHGNIIRNGAVGTNGINVNNANNEIYNNEIYSNPGSGISISPNYNTNYSGVLKIYGNSIHDQGNYGIIVGSSDSSRYARIYNNIIWDNGSYEVNFPGGASENVVMYNTIYRSKSGHGIRVQAGANSNRIMNNIIRMQQGYGIYDSTGNIIEDYNCIYRNTAGALIAWQNSFYYSLADYVAASSEGQHSIQGDPDFADITSFNLTEISPCRGTAFSDPEVLYDYFGTLRGSTPDIGAVQNSGVISPLTFPLAPSGLRLSN